MKYAIKYYRGCPLLSKADEIIVKYTERDAEILEFIKKFDEKQTITLDITQLEDDLASLEIFKAAAASHNFSLLCYENQSINDFYSLNIPFFFPTIAQTPDQLKSFYDLGVSDIYVGGDLGFWLKDIHDSYHGLVNIRVIPNIIQTTANTYPDKIKTFFIRPDDMDEYEKYIDYLEFAGPLDKQPVLYDIYRDQRWQGNLNTIIIGFSRDVNCMNIVPNFGLTRVNCKKRCDFGKCHICDHILGAAEILSQKDIYITKEKRIYESEIDETAMPYGSDDIIESDD